MNDSKNNKLHLSELLIKLLEGTISDEHFADLQHQLSSDPAARRYYLQYMKVSSALSRLAQIGDIEIPPTTAENADFFPILEKLAEYEKNGIPVEGERNKELVERVLTEEEREAKIRAFIREQKAIGEQERLLDELERRKIREQELRRRRRVQMARVVTVEVRRYLRNAAIAAMFLFIVYAYFNHRIVREEVAEISDSINAVWIADSINAVWSEESITAMNGTRLLNNSRSTAIGSDLYPEDGKLWLQGGFVKLLFSSGAQVVIESPARFEVLSGNEMNLLEGKAYSMVPKEAAGFTIHMPGSSVVDLGTEFGIDVGSSGSSVHVIKGKASLITEGDMSAQRPIELTAGLAKRISNNGLVSNIKVNIKKFVTDISSTMGAIVRNDQAVYIGRWKTQLNIDCANDLRTDGELVEAVNVGPESKPVTVGGIPFTVSAQANPVGIKVSETNSSEFTFYYGQDKDISSLLSTSRILTEIGSEMQKQFTGLEIGQFYRVQVVVGFGWEWCDALLYGAYDEYMYFPNPDPKLGLADGASLGLASYTWKATSSEHRIIIQSPKERGYNYIPVFGYVLHKLVQDNVDWSIVKPSNVVKDKDMR